MKQKILQIFIALMLIITLTLANVLIIGVNVVSYALDELNAERITNHKNIEFMAYFKDDKGNIKTELDTIVNNQDLSLYFQISVKKEGYFNGNIKVDDSNFTLKTDVLSEVVNKIENNTIYLNQINAGETKDIEISIDTIKDKELDLNLINKQSSISIDGIYKDSTEKDIIIKANREVTLNYIVPTDVQEKYELSQEIVTNKILNYSGENKRIIQLQVKSSFDEITTPIKKSVFTVKVPKILNNYPENVIVSSIDKLKTNGKQLSKENWEYNDNTGMLKIEICNDIIDNKVSWIKSGEDCFIITYIFDKDVEIDNEELLLDSKLEFYDNANTIIDKSNKIVLNKEETNSIISTDIKQLEESIYKGRLYAGISRDISYTTDLKIALNNVYNEVTINEEGQTINGENLNLQIDSVYKTSTLNKINLQEVLGEEGVLSIVDAETNRTIVEINKDIEANENGDIIVEYPENIRTIKYQLTQQKQVGKIQINNVKTINSINKEIVKNADSIVTKIGGNDVLNSESIITLKETETAVTLEINRQELSTMITNENVEFKIVLNSKNENNELFTNPSVRLELPNKFENIEVKSINLLYEDEMTIKSAKRSGNVIQIDMQGKQTNYKGNAIDGATILIKANLTTSKKIGSSTEQVKLTYTNQDAVNYKDNATIIKDIDIVSYAGIVTTNQIEEYGLEVINNEGQSTAKLNVAEDKTKNITIQKQIINNKEDKISNVKILGVFPTKEAIKDVNNIEMTIKSQISVNGINENRVKVYYTNNENATEDLEDKANNWTNIIEDYKNVKKYLVVIDELNVLEEVDLSYEVEIPANLEYNETAEEGYNVYYTDNVTAVNSKIKSKNLSLTTGKGATLETNLVALVGGKQVSEVKEAEIIKYIVSITNTGTEEISNPKIVGQIPEGTTYVKINRVAEDDEEPMEYISEFPDKKFIESQIEGIIGINETRTFEYLVRVNKGISDGKEISNTIKTVYSNIEKQSNTVKNVLRKGDLELQLYPFVNYDDLKIGYTYTYFIDVKNISKNDKTNIEVKLDSDNEYLKCFKMWYYDDNDKLTESYKNTINIERLPANTTIKIPVYLRIESFNNISAKEVQIVSTANVNGIIYNSNDINKKAITAIMEISNNSKQDGQYIKAGSEVQYNIKLTNKGEAIKQGVKVVNEFSSYLIIDKIYKNGQELKNTDYMTQYNKDKNTTQIILSQQIEENEIVDYKIDLKVDSNIGNKEAINLYSYAKVLVSDIEIAKTDDITHILEPDKNSTKPNENDGSENNKNDPSNPSNKDDSENRIVSGVAWIDENEDGKKQSSEKTIGNMKVRVLNINTNKFEKDISTDENGFYTIQLQKGKYMVVFEYDTSSYNLTDYQIEGANDKESSKVVNNKMEIDGVEKTVATSSIIEVSDSNIANINIGLKQAKVFDLKLEKFIDKVIVQNSKGTSTQEYNDTTLAKAEINAKLLNQTTVVVEYKIKVTNVGEVEGYVKKIVDYLSTDYKFSSDMNKDWYQSNGAIYNSSLANEKIRPGESKEVTLVVTKTMTESNTGLINNTAEIAESYNEKGIKDTNSIEGNKAKGENDMGSADLIISIKTGEIVTVVMLVITTVLVVGVTMYIVLRKIIVKGI